MNRFDDHLEPRAANRLPLTPTSFLDRAALIRPDHVAVVHGDRRRTYREFRERARRLGAALAARGVGPGDCVAIMAANTPEMLEAHHGVPLIGAVLNSLNVRLDARTIAFILEHGEASILIVDREFAPTVRAALDALGRHLPTVVIDDPLFEVPAGREAEHELPGATGYEAFVGGADPEAAPHAVTDEWQACSLLYTSGTTGDPKGCVYHHRGAYLNALGNLMTMELGRTSRYLWTLPMFHCDGWTFTWAVTAAMATHVCLRRVDPVEVFRLIGEEDVTHMCGAPIVLNLLTATPEGHRRRASAPVRVMTGGAAPPSAVIEAMEGLGFEVVHAYGLTETYGPSLVCLEQDDWPELALEERSARIARQGVGYPTLEAATVLERDAARPVASDGETLGELAVRGNTVMKGYLKNPEATERAMGDGWFRTGDLGVMHPDGYIEVRDRAKDIVITGGENVSTLEVEEALYRHPAVLEAAVVARPDEKWGETPCAFVTLRDGASATEAELVAFCRERVAGFKVPRTVVFAELPKTSTGKIQKFELRERAKAL